MTKPLLKTPLHALHQELGGKMVAFAGYEMPVQYRLGVLKEHLHTREKAGLFDVSHMGQAFLTTKEADAGAADAHEKIADAIETLVPGEIRKLKKGGLRYSVLLNEEGGVLDDLMITRAPEDEKQGSLFLVVNAATKDDDFALMEEKLGARARLQIADDRALLALQGPAAAGVVDKMFAGAGEQPFMTMTRRQWNGAEIFVSRCGYTGEDGFELSVPAGRAEALARTLLDEPDVEAIGLGARDSLRLEAGLCLYGHDLTPETTPVEGDIAFVIGKRRRAEGGFPGAERILRHLEEGPAQRRIGLVPEGRAPAREGAEIQSTDGETIGAVTSGGYGPSVGGPIAMGYVGAPYAAPGTQVQLMVRGKALPARVAETPFAPHRYYRG
ncbi:MAG: glycine cleavage system aminomethyltransferase GcvT [Pseudomonadota bacterium]